MRRGSVQLSKDLFYLRLSSLELLSLLFIFIGRLYTVFMSAWDETLPKRKPPPQVADWDQKPSPKL
jgi:hypothetical protein